MTAVAFVALSCACVVAALYAALYVMSLRSRVRRRHRRMISGTRSIAATTGIRRLVGNWHVAVPVDALSDDEVSRRFERIVRIEWAA